MKTRFTYEQVSQMLDIDLGVVMMWIRHQGLAAYGERISRGTLIKFLRSIGLPLTGELVIPVKVLLVGMTEEVGRQLAYLLSKDSVEVQTVPDVENAEIQIQSTTPDFFLVDFSIGRATALKFAERLSGDEALKGVSVYGFHGEEDIKGMAQWGFFDELQVKPVEPEDLAHLIRLRTMFE